jgi:hypothetical protein
VAGHEAIEVPFELAEGRHGGMGSYRWWRRLPESEREPVAPFRKSTQDHLKKSENAVRLRSIRPKREVSKRYDRVKSGECLQIYNF